MDKSIVTKREELDEAVQQRREWFVVSEIPKWLPDWLPPGLEEYDKWDVYDSVHCGEDIMVIQVGSIVPAVHRAPKSDQQLVDAFLADDSEEELDLSSNSNALRSEELRVVLRFERSEVCERPRRPQCVAILQCRSGEWREVYCADGDLINSDDELRRLCISENLAEALEEAVDVESLLELHSAAELARVIGTYMTGLAASGTDVDDDDGGYGDGMNSETDDVVASEEKEEERRNKLELQSELLKSIPKLKEVMMALSTSAKKLAADAKNKSDGKSQKDSKRKKKQKSLLSEMNRQQLELIIVQIMCVDDTILDYLEVKSVAGVSGSGGGGGDGTGGKHIEELSELVEELGHVLRGGRPLLNGDDSGNVDGLSGDVVRLESILKVCKKCCECGKKALKRSLNVSQVRKLLWSLCDRLTEYIVKCTSGVVVGGENVKVERYSGMVLQRNGTLTYLCGELETMWDEIVAKLWRGRNVAGLEETWLALTQWRDRVKSILGPVFGDTVRECNMQMRKLQRIGELDGEGGAVNGHGGDAKRRRIS